jgi:hypothetical protein
LKIIDNKTPPTKKARAHLLLHGESGSGKTTFSVTGGRPFVVCYESKAESTILSINPNAIIAVPESIDDIRAIAKALRSPLEPESIKMFPGVDKATRVILDSWTEMTSIVGGFIGGGANLQLAQYGDIQKIVFGFLGLVQAGPLPSIIIARSEVQEQGSGVMRISKIVPASLGKSVNMLPGKLVCTLQAVSVNEQGESFTIESGPSDSARRSGLPWLPSSWKAATDGDADKLLAVVEAGPVKKGA